MEDSRAIVDEVLGAMGQIVARDGGELELTSFAVGDPVVQVEFRTPQASGDCETCVITADMLSAFLLEGLRSHGLEIDKVEVTTAPVG